MLECYEKNLNEENIMNDKIKELQLEYFSITKKRMKESLLAFLKVLLIAVFEGGILLLIQILQGMKVGGPMVFTLQITLYIFSVVLLIILIKEGWKTIKLTIKHFKDKTARDILREIKRLENES